MNVSQAPKWLPELLVPFFTLSYPIARPNNPDSYPGSNYYETGRLDGCFVLTWILVLGILRECLRLGFLEPFGRQYLYRKDMVDKGAVDTALKTANGLVNGIVTSPKSAVNGDSSHATTSTSPPLISSKNVVNQRPKGMSKAVWKRERSVVRFAEQGWQFAYYIVYWPLGFYIHWGLPSAPFRLDRLWLNYPHTPLAGPLKFYYLTQLGFWCHQVLLLNAEAWRKDHLQMMSHHIITISLVIASYSYNFTRVGVLIMVLMDWCDIFLAAVKICRYLKFPDIVSHTVFSTFALSWIITRHVLFGIVIYSAYNVAPLLIPFTWAPERGHYLTRDAYLAFVGLMVALQVILCGWALTIFQVIWSVLRGSPPDDARSDDDGEGSSEDTEHTTKKKQ
ncbi:longevity assurance proteins LAG1/LAC1 [Ramaria rubella]|nr:longevity assurance proteins LAG1/LAC1 [Ramaria rubella]